MASVTHESLKSLTLKNAYTSSQDSMVDSFYLPCLSSSAKYDRAVGYFSSAIFILINSALSPFIQNGGKLRIICSPELSTEDASAIKEGSSKALSITEDKINEQLANWDETFGNSAPSSLLRNLISSGVLEMRIAVPTVGPGIYHPKIGIFTDADENAISFVGSANETMRGWSDAGNHEYFDVFRSWVNSEDEVRVKHHKKVFEETWLGLVSGLKIYKSSDLEKVFKPRENDLPFHECVEILNRNLSKRNTLTETDIPTDKSGRVLQSHQEEVLKNWKRLDHKGVISFVTGGGKTLTALRAAKYWLDLGKPVLILVPSKLLHEQWQDEIALELEPFGYHPILIGNDASKSIWRNALRSIFTKSATPQAALFLSTYQTAKKSEFLSSLQNTSDLLLIADEAHRLGAPDARVIIETLNCPGRLALSATYERFGDEIGSESLQNFFVNELEPKFTLDDAIKAKRLVPYVYEFEIAELTSEEEDSFDEYTEKLIKSLDWSSGKAVMTFYSQHWARQRANVVKDASDKDRIALSLLSNINKRDRWLVYCNSINHIDRLAQKLKDLGIDSLIYHSQMQGDRKSTLDYFEREGGILLSVKCLDEGVDIPKLDRALILASSTNPREYIQRRGRALRIAKDKYHAYLYDVIVTKQDGQPALISDVDRAESFAHSANNLFAQTRLREMQRYWNLKNGQIGLAQSEVFEEDDEVQIIG